MKFNKKPIFTGFAPNISTQDFKIVLSFFCWPPNWFKLKKGDCDGGVKVWLKKYFKTENVFTFDSGRTSLHYALKSLGVSEGDEVLVQAYTCVVVLNAINWTLAKPVYVDIGNDFNMDPMEMEKKITEKTKVLIIQHTFGLPANLDQLIEIARKNNVKIIEDCAHAFGVRYNGKLLGTFGDIGMFSFGSDKVVSCVRGGALITNDRSLAEKLKIIHDRLPNTGMIKIIQHLSQIIFFYTGKPFYNLGIGKLFLSIAKSFNLMNKIIYNQEKIGKQVLFYPTKLPNALACILIAQLQDLEKRNEHRRSVAKEYFKLISNTGVLLPKKSTEGIYLRFTLLSKNRNKIIDVAKKEGIILGRWYDTPIVPRDIDIKKTGYIKGTCPNAEKLAELSFNLPTHFKIRNKEIRRIVDVINKTK